MVVSLCTDSTEKDLLQEVVFSSFLGQEISGIKKKREFLCLVPFPLPVSGEVLLFLLIIRERKTDSD